MFKFFRVPNLPPPSLRLEHPILIPSCVPILDHGLNMNCEANHELASTAGRNQASVGGRTMPREEDEKGLVGCLDWSIQGVVIYPRRSQPHDHDPTSMRHPGFVGPRHREACSRQPGTRRHHTASLSLRAGIIMGE